VGVGDPEGARCLRPAPPVMRRMPSVLTSVLAQAHDGSATLANVPREGKIMKITFLGKDSTPNDSPTLYATDRESYLVQGYVVTDPEALAQMRIPEGEAVVEVPKVLMKYLPPEELKRLLENTPPEGVNGEGHG
jgi:hypothetical protein